MSYNPDNTVILDTETFAIAVAEAMAIAEADKADLIARSKREAATAITDAAAVEAKAKAIAIANANAEADEAEKIAHLKREAANAATTALYASKTMVESGLTEITVDDEEPTIVAASIAAGRTHASRAARKAERKAAMKARYWNRPQAVKANKKAREKAELAREEQRFRDYLIQATAREAEIQMRVSVEIELRNRGFRR
jgi:hypothetical protein